MAFNEYLAIRFTTAYARATGWPVHADQVCDVLGLKNPSPTAKEFVHAVHRWQQTHPPLVADGILGPKTWSKMLPAVKADHRVTTDRFAGKFISALRSSAAAASNNAASSRPVAVPVPSQVMPSAEDQLMAQMAEETLNNTDVHVAYPVSAAEVAWAARLTSPQAQWVLPRTVVPTVKIGQKWPGASNGGYRIVLAFAPPNIYFITDSGRTYVENGEGWQDDYVTLIYQDTAQRLGQLETILDVEASFLEGMCAATGAPGMIAILGGSAVQWTLNNKQKLKMWEIEIEAIWELDAALRKLAPTFHAKVFRAAGFRVLKELPKSLISNPRIVAKLLGQLIVVIGKAVLEEDFSAVITFVKAIAPLGAIKAAIVDVSIAAAKAIPGAAKLAVSSAQDQIVKAKNDLFLQLSKQNINLEKMDMDAIMKEIASHPKELMRAFEDFEDAIQAI